MESDGDGVTYSFEDDTRWWQEMIREFAETSISLSIVRLEDDTTGFTKLPFHYLIFVACGLAVKINIRDFR